MTDGLVTMSWVSRITKCILFGPAPRGTDDVDYLTQRMGVGHFINLLPTSASFTRVSEYSGKRAMKRAVPLSQAYMGCYDDDEHVFPAIYHGLPFNSSTIQPKGRLKEEQMHNLAVEYVKHAKKVVGAVKGNNSAIYIHARDGFNDEAFIAFAVWGLAKDPHAPANIASWFSQTVGSGGGGDNGPIVNKGVFGEDEENMKLLTCIWSEARKPASPFDRGVK